MKVSKIAKGRGAKSRVWNEKGHEKESDEGQ